MTEEGKSLMPRCVRIPKCFYRTLRWTWVTDCAACWYVYGLYADARTTSAGWG